MAKYIFITGGVVSSLGKGITAASIGRILKSRGIGLTIQKLDPYLNVDPGTMSPYQHGEVFVTKDGAETDLDLGHYERFIDIELTTTSNLTAGQIYRSIITKERKGDFLGGTIQVVPHVTDEIKRQIKGLAEKTGAEVVIVEVGGTVGDIEGQPFLEAIRQMKNDVGRENVLYIHLTLLPYLSTTGELKTKPTQHSVAELRRMGIQPDVIICRSEHPVPESIKEKIALFCDVEKRAVIPLLTVPTIYEIPLILEEAGLGKLIIEKLSLKSQEPDFSQWCQIIYRLKAPKEKVYIGLVGKYVELKDAYLSVKEALTHATLYHNRDVEIVWIHSENLEKGDGFELLSQVQGIVVPGGFGVRGIEGMIKAARYARENKIPYLGLCLGLQVMVIEFARHIFDSSLPNSTEFAPDTPCPVIDFLPEQRGCLEKGGTMRLGAYPCHLVEGTKAFAAYGMSIVYERHRHRYEFNNSFREIMASHGLIASGLSPDGRLVEIVELKEHPFMIGVQFHPEFCSRPDRPHPLFRDFIGVAKQVLRRGEQILLPL